MDTALDTFLTVNEAFLRGHFSAGFLIALTGQNLTGLPALGLFGILLILNHLLLQITGEQDPLGAFSDTLNFYHKSALIMALALCNHLDIGSLLTGLLIVGSHAAIYFLLWKAAARMAATCIN